jgi:hypothetical protein
VGEYGIQWRLILLFFLLEGTVNAAIRGLLKSVGFAGSYLRISTIRLYGVDNRKTSVIVSRYSIRGAHKCPGVGISK